MTPRYVQTHSADCDYPLILKLCGEKVLHGIGACMKSMLLRNFVKTGWEASPPCHQGD